MLNKKILLIANGQETIDTFLLILDNFDQVECTVSSFKDAISSLEQNTSSFIFLEHDFNYKVAEEVAIRFSELLMFDKASMFLLTKEELPKLSTSKFLSLGISTIIKFESVKSLLTSLIDTEISTKKAC